MVYLPLLSCHCDRPLPARGSAERPHHWLAAFPVIRISDPAGKVTHFCSQIPYHDEAEVAGRWLQLPLEGNSYRVPWRYCLPFCDLEQSPVGSEILATGNPSTENMSPGVRGRVVTSIPTLVPGP